MDPRNAAGFQKTIQAMASAAGKPLLYGANGQPLAPSSEYSYRRTAARRTGSMKNWIPQRVFSRNAEAKEREAIVARSIELSQNDPHAFGVLDNMATMVIGSGLKPYPTLNRDMLQIKDKKEVRRIQRIQSSVFEAWTPWADAGGRMTFGQLCYLLELSMARYGEYFILFPMLKDPIRPYSLACKIVHPLRVKTPVDKQTDGTIQDGIELGDFGQTVAVWIKKSSPTGKGLADNSANFMRVPVRKGHRYNIIHRFICREPEQVRGMPILAPALKYFRDFSDLIDAELVSNVVTAALAYFIEVPPGEDAMTLAEQFGTDTDPEYVTNAAGSDRKQRYEEVYPGGILYGNSGEKPHLLAADRPGTTFEPFTLIVKKAMSMAVNLPYNVAFKDLQNINHAGFRAAMLDAWRVVSMKRTWLGDDTCQPIYTMLQEEAYLRGQWTVKHFYRNMHFATRAEWIGPPKGDIEPIKAAKADIMLNQENLKTKAKIMTEHGNGNIETTFDQIQEERELEKEKGLAVTESEIEGAE